MRSCGSRVLLNRKVYFLYLFLLSPLSCVQGADDFNEKDNGLKPSCTYSNNRYWAVDIPDSVACVMIKNTKEKAVPNRGRVSFHFSGIVEALEFYSDAECEFDTYIPDSDTACSEEQDISLEDKITCVQTRDTVTISNIPPLSACLLGENLELPIALKNRRNVTFAEGLDKIGKLRIFKDSKCSVPDHSPLMCGNFDRIKCTRSIGNVKISNIPSTVMCIRDIVNNFVYVVGADGKIDLELSVLSDVALEYFSNYDGKTKRCTGRIPIGEDYKHCPTLSYFPLNAVNEMRKMFDITNIIDNFEGHGETPNTGDSSKESGSNGKSQRDIERERDFEEPNDDEVDFMHYGGDPLRKLDMQRPFLETIDEADKEYYKPREEDNYFGDSVVEDTTLFASVDPSEMDYNNEVDEI
eukprot:Nk52_evm11s554 gene=Nk52_evmTU11s554